MLGLVKGVDAALAFRRLLNLPEEHVSQQKVRFRRFWVGTKNLAQLALCRIQLRLLDQSSGIGQLICGVSRILWIPTRLRRGTGNIRHRLRVNRSPQYPGRGTNERRNPHSGNENRRHGRDGLPKGSLDRRSQRQRIMLTGTALRLISSHRSLVRDKAEAKRARIFFQSLQFTCAGFAVPRSDSNLRFGEARLQFIIHETGFPGIHERALQSDYISGLAGRRTGGSLNLPGCNLEQQLELTVAVCLQERGSLPNRLLRLL